MNFQDFTLDFYMRQTWQDPRLAFGELRLGGSDKPIKSLTVSSSNYAGPTEKTH